MMYRAAIFSGLRAVFATALLTLLIACSSPSAPPQQGGVDALRLAILEMDPTVDPDEAARAARIAFSYSRQLAEAYEIEDPPLIHNIKVNSGVKARGLCWHWAEDMEKRLNQEQFTTLTMHRAIAEHPWRIDHSTAIISANGEAFDEGIVLDPWRTGGTLFWTPVTEDPRYVWEDRRVVLARRQ